MDETWKTVTLNAVISLGGRLVPLQEIYRTVKSNPIVTDYHRQPWRSGGQPRFECWVRRILTDFVREKKLSRVKKGVYSLN